jgi:lisH domain-containing protein FOPNL
LLLIIFPAVRDTLESRGVLNQLKARIRAEVFSALEDGSEPRPPLSHHNLLINQLVGDYLEFNQYRYAASVLKAGELKPATARDPSHLVRVHLVSA